MITNIRQQDNYTVYVIDSHKDLTELKNWLEKFELSYHIKQITVSRSEVWVEGGIDCEIITRTNN